ncbi:MAG: GDSL-type esterase/lipase family protein [Planctomycetota bacterium]
MTSSSSPRAVRPRRIGPLVAALTVFLAPLRAQEEAPAPRPGAGEGEAEGRVAFVIDLADAAVGGDGRRPTEEPPGPVVASLPNGAFTRVPRAILVDGVFVPRATGTTVVASSGLAVDLSESVGSGRGGPPPAKGPSGAIEDPSGSLGLPDYRAAGHALLEMHACAGITFDLGALRGTLGAGARLKRFRAVAGGSTARDTGFLVLVDGEVRAGERLVGRAWKEVEIDLGPEARFLTLVTTDAGEDDAFGRHAFFGDPIVEGEGPIARRAPAAVEPWPDTEGFLPWKPIRLGPALGVEYHELALWREGEEEPADPTVVGRKGTLRPDAPLEYDTAYRARVTVRTVDGRRHRGEVFGFRTASLAAAEPRPAFDVSPSARRERAARYEREGLERLAGAGTPLPKGATLAFWGDSITDVTRYQRFIEEALRDGEGTRELGVRVLNRGINGAKVSDLLAGRRRWPRGGGPQRPRPAAEQMKEDAAEVVVIFVGVNESNYLRAGTYPEGEFPEDSPPTSDEEFRRDLTALVRAARSAGSRVVLGSPALRGERIDGSNPLDARLDRLAGICAEVAVRESATFVPVREAVVAWLRNHNWRLDREGRLSCLGDRGRLTGDGIHPNPVGQRLLAELFADGIVRSMFSGRSGAAPDGEARAGGGR